MVVPTTGIDESHFGVLNLIAITYKELLEHTTLHGFKYLVQAKRSMGEK